MILITDYKSSNTLHEFLFIVIFGYMQNCSKWEDIDLHVLFPSINSIQTSIEFYASDTLQ